jgi:WD40 repeat protein
VGFSADGRFVITGSFDATVGLWDAASGEMLAALRGHGRVVTAARIAPGGERALSGAEDGSLALWNISSAPVAPGTVDWLLRCRVSGRVEAGKIVARATRDRSCKRMGR